MTQSKLIKTITFLVLAIGMNSPTAALDLGDPPKPPAAPEFEAYTGGPRFTSESPTETIQSTFTWSVSVINLAPGGKTPRGQAAQRPNFKVCVVKPQGSKPSGSNKCYEFDSLNCPLTVISKYVSRWDCTGEFTLHPDLANVSSEWYVRAEHPDSHKIYSNSNVLPFAWEVLLPNLFMDYCNTVLFGTLTSSVDVKNNGDTPVVDPVVRFTVAITTNDQVKQTTMHDVTIEQTIFPGGVGSISLELQAPLRDLWPFSAEVGYMVDPDNVVLENDESDNTCGPTSGTWQ